MQTRKNIYTGTSGLVVPEANKSLYPAAFRDKSRLTYYASLFNSIEINSSFKKIPMPQTVEKWAASVPDSFQFTFKCWNGITHNKELAFEPGDIFHFVEVAGLAGKKKGCLLAQFPGKLTIAHAGQLEKLLTILRQADPDKQWKVAIEFRNSSWYDPDIYDLLHRNHMAVVFHDMPFSAPPLNAARPTFVYLRFHGPEKGYRGSYREDYLFNYARQIKAWSNEGKYVYVYFNNTLGSAINNLMTLSRYIDSP